MTLAQPMLLSWLSLGLRFSTLKVATVSAASAPERLVVSAAKLLFSAGRGAKFRILKLPKL